MRHVLCTGHIKYRYGPYKLCMWANISYGFIKPAPACAVPPHVRCVQIADVLSLLLFRLGFSGLCNQ